MNAPSPAPRYGVDAYLEFIAREGVPVVDNCYAVDGFAVKTDHWARVGMKAAALHLEGRGDYCNMFVYESPPGGKSEPMQHLYEDLYYVLDGHGSTQIELADGGVLVTVSV